MSGPAVVLDASAVVDVLLGATSAAWVGGVLRDRDVHVPGHFHAETLSALGRLHRSGARTTEDIDAMVRALTLLPARVVPVGGLVEGAWNRRDQHSLPDALYVELAAHLDTVVITTDRRLARATPFAVAPPE